MMPLGLLNTGEKAEVIEYLQPLNRQLGEQTSSGCGRIGDMGLRSGKVVEMLNNEGRGAVLIKVGEARIALGRGMAMKIMVRRKN